MLQILLHSSKTMTNHQHEYAPSGMPRFTNEATQLVSIWRKASPKDVTQLMQVSEKKASETKELYKGWSADASLQIPAIDAFRGDIYSGLQAASWSEAERRYAHEHLLILSGLYGVLRACDGIRPYRLEMGYKLPSGRSMYEFWSNKLARVVSPGATHLINLSAVEYTKALLPYVSQEVITPKFMTISPKTGQPVFVTVHAKIARGAFANWLIHERIEDSKKLPEFTNLGYCYEPNLSTKSQPVFVCETFQGLGLSVRLA